MKYKIILCLCMFVVTGSLLAQPTASNSSQQEQVFVHLNNTVFLTGEYVFYKTYVTNTTKKSYSKISDIAFVELISEDLQVVFRHKVRLDEGKGYSDFFIPNTVLSGNYKLLSYTPHMIAGVKKQFFETDIVIINPYQADQTVILSNAEDGTIVNKAKTFTEKKSIKTNSFQMLEIEMEKTNFNKRERVSFNLKNNSAEAGLGNYSISVVKKEEITGTEALMTTNFSTEVIIDKASKNTFRKTSNKGTVVQGGLVNVQTNIPQAGKDIALSIPGKDFVFKVTTTDAAGNFSFVLAPTIDAEKAILQVLDEAPENFKFNLQKEAGIPYDLLKFNHFTMDASLQEMIQNRSVYNQIENAYYSVKPDTIKATTPPKSFIHFEEKISYDLDHYNRFPTLQETITEYVTFISPARDKDGNRVLKAFQRDLSAETEYLPLLLIDGVFVLKHSDFLAVDVKTIQTITLVQRDYQFGATDYQGVILLETMDNSYGKNRNSTPYHEIALFTAQPKKNYYKQNYDANEEKTFSHIPDYRHQLVWDPSVTVSTSNTPFSFYASDVTGSYVVLIEGFTQFGIPISVKKEIRVVD